ncbi:MAG: HAD-IC family P-type ATPase [bacterium]|nr:HAD-IC family P-type ATPase [bacterium]
MENNWHLKSEAEVLKELQSGGGGLSREEVDQRLKKYGPNKLPEAEADSLAVIFSRQFKSPLIYVLFAAAVIIFIVGEIADGAIILAVLLFNAVIGAIQEGRAQNTLLALKKFTETKAAVLRQGLELIVPDFELVPGDVIILREGERVPADARVILSRNLNLDEAMLTGESEPARKLDQVLKQENLTAGEMKNMVFKGTLVMSGNGKAVVTATATSTVIGQIAKKIAAIDTETPFKASLRQLARLIVAAVGGISALLFMFGVLTGKTVWEMFLTVVTLSVSIIPEGLPIVMTLVLATGVWRMSKQNVLVKKLQAVEALGQAKVIAVDKTGTMTKNEMVVQEVYAGGKFFTVTGAGYEPKGEIRLEEKAVCAPNHPELAAVGKISCFCSGARVMFNEDAKQWSVAGDPTEAAMNVLAQKLGFNKDDLEREAPLAADFPFDYKLKYHAAFHLTGGKKILSVVGAPEVILKLCDKVKRGGKSFNLTDEERSRLELIFLEMSRRGTRVVALAENLEPPEVAKPEAIGGLTFVAFLGMRDALRPEAVEAVKKISAAGIKVVMITGDHKNTACAIAAEAGIYRPGDAILTGAEIDELSDKQLEDKIVGAAVFARVTPDHKLRIIQSYKARGQIIAMTGDGINDAPSLVAADLGVAMGGIGTEVAKEAADLVLLDDNLSNIVSAVEEGRNIYKTIKKVILYLFSTSAGEVLVIAGALALSYPLPLLPAQIIWLNFVTDGFLVVAFAMEPKEERLLSKKFSRPARFIVDKLMLSRIIVMALPMAIGSLYIFHIYLAGEPAKAWTVSLTVLAVFQWFNVWNCRSDDKTVFSQNPLSNKFLAGATVLVIGLQLLAVYHPWLQKILHTVPLALADWLIIVPLALSVIAAEEIRKLFYRRRLKVYN